MKQTLMLLSLGALTLASCSKSDDTTDPIINPGGPDTTGTNIDVRGTITADQH